MPLGQTRFTIIRSALLELGDEPIQSLGEESVSVEIVQSRYEEVIDSLLAIQSWRFATTVRKLALLAEVPGTPGWEYAYQLPRDYLRAQTLIEKTGYVLNFGVGNPDTKQDYEIYGKQLWCNRKDVLLQYTRRATEEEWSATFHAAAVVALASANCLAITENTVRHRQLMMRKDEMLAEARTQDAQQRPPPSVRRDPLTDARR